MKNDTKKKRKKTSEKKNDNSDYKIKKTERKN